MSRHFSNWLQGYLDYTSASESPTPFHFWTGVATIAGALRRRVWIDMRYFQWAPNFYIVLVGPPGVAAKSTTIQSGMKLLERLKVPFGPSSMTWQALAKSLEESIQTVIQKTRDSPFLQGDNKENWTASFDWIFKPANFLKILENNFFG